MNRQRRLAWKLLPAVTLAFALAAGGCQSEPKLNILETINEDGAFTTFSTAVEAVHLAETLQGEGPFTLFAPRDEAFKKLPYGMLDNLLRPENKADLQALLKYHVAPGRFYAEDLRHMSATPSLLGKELRVFSYDRGVMINNARVIEADIKCTNGVIHVVDSVILPE